MSEMKRVKVSELEGAALDYAVDVALGEEPEYTDDGNVHGENYSTEFSQGGPLIERFRLMLFPSIIYETGEVTHWCAVFEMDESKSRRGWVGETPLIAAMRAIVASVMGDEVEVPACLVGESGG